MTQIVGAGWLEEHLWDGTFGILVLGEFSVHFHLAVGGPFHVASHVVSS
jgi:hypothetical protein